MPSMQWYYSKFPPPPAQLPNFPMLAAPVFQQWKAEKHLWMKETIFQLESKLNVMVWWTYTNWATLALAEFHATSSWRVRIVPSNHISTICEFCSQNWRTWKTAGTYIHRHSLIFRLDLFPLHRRRWKVLQSSHWVLWYSMQRKQIVQPWEWSRVHECILCFNARSSSGSWRFDS